MTGTLLWVGLGGALGAMLRYATVLGLAPMLGHTAAAILLINVLGSGLMGVAVAVLVERGGPTWAPPLLMAGVLGGFTTFSTFSADAVGLMERGRLDLALAYAAASVVLSIAALWAGLTLARSLL